MQRSNSRIAWSLLFLVLLPFSMQARPIPSAGGLPRGLVAYWRADGNARDEAGGHGGKIINNVRYETGKVGRAFYFNGAASNFVQVADAPDLRLTSELTITFWVKRFRLDFPQRPYADFVLEKGGDWTGGQLNYGVALHNPDYNNCLHFTFAGGWRGAGAVKDFEWHHCAVVARDGDANPTFYIDGVAQPVLYGEGDSTVHLFPSTAPLHLGGEIDPNTGWQYYAQILLDEVCIFNRALSKTEVKTVLLKSRRIR